MILWALVVTGWSAGTLLLWRLPALNRFGPAVVPPRSGLRVSVVVPARDEAASLPALLASLAAQERSHELIVVDDGSTDATAALAASAGARVLTAPPRPDGWLGKPWALHTGGQAASGDVLVLLDADVVLAPGALDRLLAVHAAEVPDGLLSVQPFHVVDRPYEHLSLLPNIVPLLAAGIGRIGGPGRAEQELAFGPCLVVTPTALHAVGGFPTVKGEIVEDAAMAQAMRAAGRPVRCCTGGDLVRFRMYPTGVRGLVQGWTKNLAAGALIAPLGPTLGALLWVTAVLGSVQLLLTSPWPVAVALWTAFAGQLRWMGRRVGTFRWWSAAFYPLLATAFVALFAKASWHQVTGRPVVWRGRRIRPGEVVG